MEFKLEIKLFIMKMDHCYKKEYLIGSKMEYKSNIIKMDLSIKSLNIKMV